MWQLHISGPDKKNNVLHNLFYKKNIRFLAFMYGHVTIMSKAKTLRNVSFEFRQQKLFDACLSKVHNYECKSLPKCFEIIT